MKRFITLLLITVASISACASSGDTRKPLLSTNQLIAVEASKQWQLIKELDPQAEIQLGRKDERAFMLVYAYDRQQINYPGLPAFAKVATESLLKNLQNTRQDKPLTGNIRGLPTVVYSVAGERNQADYLYFSAAIEGQHAVYWVVAWCLSRDYDKVGDNLVDTLYGVRELP